MYKSDVDWIECVVFIMNVVPMTLWFPGLTGIDRGKGIIPNRVWFAIIFGCTKAVDEILFQRTDFFLENSVMYYIGRLAVLGIIYFYIMLLPLRGTWVRKIVAFSAFEVIACTAYYGRVLMMYMSRMTGFYDFIAQNEAALLLVRIIMEWSPYFILYYLLRKQIRWFRETEIANSRMSYCIVALFVIVELGCVPLYAIKGFQYRGLLMFLVMPICLVIVIVFRVSYLMQESSRMQLQKQLMQSHYAAIKTQVEWAEQLRHDIGRHFEALKEMELAKQEAADVYRKELIGCYEKMKRIDYCSNIIIDSVLHNKVKEAKKNGIELKVEVQDIKTGNISDTDLFAVFYNAVDIGLENAIINKQKTLQIQAKNIAGQIVVEMENSSGQQEQGKKRREKTLAKLIKGLGGSMEKVDSEEGGKLLLSIPCEP